ncbi:hypothetical protein [Aquipuribacter hungaricus]|uniref:Flagellar FliJ protein n=1 Tax=Aquipuribacter hungaricus TaxID=545624 RepID=A0ABV7WK48_9MICO
MSLVGLLGLRRTARTAAERDRVAATAVRARTQELRDDVVGRMHGDPHLTDCAGDVRLLLARRAGQLADLSRADDMLALAVQEEDRQQVLVAQARLRLKAVERLQERRQTEERLQRDRRAALELEDVVAGVRRARADAARATQDERDGDPR